MPLSLISSLYFQFILVEPIFQKYFQSPIFLSFNSLLFIFNVLILLRRSFRLESSPSLSFPFPPAFSLLPIFPVGASSLFLKFCCIAQLDVFLFSKKKRERLNN
ncbi:unnamed protein product [Meloidogyne enterolobii]|uniref:Uncharacterized protein n=1 Tax=Meloidogyne enterolobii TaxID=390850 RepID=A0ACB0XKP8_MELEN